MRQDGSNLKMFTSLTLTVNFTKFIVTIVMSQDNSYPKPFICLSRTVNLKKTFQLQLLLDYIIETVDLSLKNYKCTKVYELQLEFNKNYHI